MDKVNQLSLKSFIGFTGSVNGGLHYTRCGRFIVFPLGSVVVLRSLVSKKQFFLDAAVDKKISCIAISKDGSFLATGHETPASFKAEITVWDLKKAIDFISNDNDALPEGCLLHVLSQHHKRVEAVDFSCAEHRLLECLDIADKADALGDVGRHFGFEGAAADKGDHRVQVLWVNAKVASSALKCL